MKFNIHTLSVYHNRPLPEFSSDNLLTSVFIFVHIINMRNSFFFSSLFLHTHTHVFRYVIISVIRRFFFFVQKLRSKTVADELIKRGGES